MSILPLPVFEAEADPRARGLSDEDLAQYERLKPPATVVVRYGYMREIAELPATLESVPGCGTKFVAETRRGTEIVSMLTTTCANGGCGHAVTRKQMLQYIDNSGGSKYPFSRKGRILRIATPEDLETMSRLEAGRKALLREARAEVARLHLPIKIVEAEPILGQELLTFFYVTASREQKHYDFTDASRALAEKFSTRVLFKSVASRDEARLTADYERCGQHCCCRQFLKVLKPVSMRQAKIQKATLDPLKISGRCGRLMCCLRYEEQTYDDLRKRLPHRKVRVLTPDGPGLVMDTQILTQLVLVQLEHKDERNAYPVENLQPMERKWRGPEGDLDPVEWTPEAPRPAAPAEDDVFRGADAQQVQRRIEGGRDDHQQRHRDRAPRPPAPDDAAAEGETAPSEPKRKRRPRRRKRRSGEGQPATDASPTDAGAPTPPPQGQGSSPQEPAGEGGEQRSKRRGRRGGRRRRRRGGNEGGGDGPAPGGEGG